MNEGRPIAESRKLAEQSLERYVRVGELWDYLSDAEQQAVIDKLELLTAEERAREL